MKIHYLKILPKYFKDVFERKKNFELRKNDRDFQIGDIIVLQEYDNGEYTGNETTRIIEYILTTEDIDFGLVDDYCIIGI